MARSKHRRRKSLIAYGAGAAVLATVATYGTIALASPSNGDTTAQNSPHALQDAFASAAAEFKVPQSVLMAVSYRQTLWDAHNGEPSSTGNYNVMGLTQINPQDLSQPTDAERLSEMNLSGDPAVSKHFNAKRALAAIHNEVNTSDPRLHTLDEAAKLTGTSASDLKKNSEQSVRGAAALLAQYEKDSYGSLPANAGNWYGAIARYSQSPDAGGADQFAKRVFQSIHTGESRVTDSGQIVTLAADPSVTPVKPAKTPLAAQADTSTTTTADCPSGLSCNFVKAGFGPDSATPPTIEGNYNPAKRPASGEDIRYIVIHDMEGTFEGSIQEFQNPAAIASAHYLVADDGRVTQMVATTDEAWHAANKTVNMHSIGVEHEGYAMKAASWYAEPEYDSSAALVKYLAGKFGIPLDRQHIIGHDEVPGVIDSLVSGQHWDPGPYWDWNHYMALLGSPVGDQGAGGPLRVGELVRIVPPYTTAYEPSLSNGGTTFAAHPANFVYLYTTPSTSGAQPNDPYLGSAAANDGSNWENKAVTGSEYVVAGTSGPDWTAIWYSGQKLWFHNPGGQYTAPVKSSSVITPAGTGAIAVYGRAYPEDAAYTGTGVAVQTNNNASLTKYSIPAGQAYAQAGPEKVGDYFNGGTYAGTAAGDRTLVTGTDEFYPIQYNHRIAWVKASDVKQISTTAPDPGTTRNNLLARDSSGVLYQYQGTGSAATPFYTRFKVGAGWGVYNSLVPLTDLKASGTGDMVARDTSGVLWYYQGSGNPSAPFKARLKVGAGWGVYNTMAGVRDVNGDGKPDLVARDSSGTLWFYQGTGTPATPFAARVKVGAGWGTYNSLVAVGDLNGDGRGDMVARDTAGTLWLYQGTGNAAAPFAPRVKIGAGWTIYNAMTGTGDVNGDGKPDMVARDSSGTLWLYKGTGSMTATAFAARTQIGTGWQIYGSLV
ncbi:N-acetylmuramoyl-L-alanine amidase [Actinacidiphila rubida]|uniref:N-acetylmuramoyl-L-alanine amidase n=1 Tax=Actinacidiphila rubida TaxID=310780 RepID=A0A1H8INV3_9ACTN|nr:N-acetylmuramoyl-L-alanine amidase [Actinacidiphila rubida]SEN70079.1 Repeat domain-containing protein [Actinacidiphila rubida]